MIVPKQLLVRSPDANNNTTQLIHGTSIFDIALEIPKENEIQQIHNINVYSLVSALVNCGSGFFTKHPIDARTCLSTIKDSSDILSIIKGCDSAYFFLRANCHSSRLSVSGFF